MNAKEKSYTMALAALLLIGLSAAWAGYSSVATISASDIADFASVSPGSGLSLTGLKKNVWFYKNVFSVFTISKVNVSDIYVLVGVINMADLADDFRSLNLNVTLKKDTTVEDWGVISLEGGTGSVLLQATGLSGSPNLTVDIYVWGRPAKTGSATISLYCAVEPATGVSA